MSSSQPPRDQIADARPEPVLFPSHQAREMFIGSVVLSLLFGGTLAVVFGALSPRAMAGITAVLSLIAAVYFALITPEPVRPGVPLMYVGYLYVSLAFYQPTWWVLNAYAELLHQLGPLVLAYLIVIFWWDTAVHELDRRNWVFSETFAAVRNLVR